MIKRESNPENEEVSQLIPPEESQPTSSIQENPVPEQLNPSANPLLFPTKPDEVKVEVETVEPITLEQAIELALRNNKDLQTARLTLERSRAELREAESAKFPTLDASVEFSRLDSPRQQTSNIISTQTIGVRNLTGGIEDTTVDGTLELNYDVYTGGRRGADIRRAKRELRRQELEVEVISEQTRFDATDDYYNLQNADAQVAIEQAAVEDATQSLRDAQLLEQAGLGTRFDVLQAEVDLANAEQALTQAIADQRTARRQLVETLSLAQNVELTAVDAIEEAGNWDLPLDKSIVLAYKNRAELEQFLLDREINEQQRTIELSETRPQVQFFANYQFFEDFEDTVGIQDGYELGARIQWRFFDGGRALARADQATKEIDIAETNFANQRNEVRLEVETAYFNLISNKDNIGTAEKAVETATERLRLARLRFQAGVGTQTEVIDAQRDLTEARGNFLQAIIGYNQSLNAIQRAVSNLPDHRLFELR
ncbi:MAG: TolC family protein [Xenococcaceae cyanobacterium]